LGGREEERVPADPGVVAARDLLHYKCTGGLMLAGWVRIGIAALRPAHEARLITPSWDAAWFIPVYAWGVESLVHLAWWLLGGEFFPYEPAFLEHGVFSIAVLVCVTGLCLGEERVARRVGLPSRDAQGTIPVPVVGAIIGVLAVWFLCTVMWMRIH
jgi:hypothetical protein